MAAQSTRRTSIPSNVPFVDDGVLEAIREVIGSHRLSGDGMMCKGVESLLETMVGAGHVLLTTSCTHALEMAVMMLDLQPGDEVITPSFTFVSAPNAILMGGGVPVFCDINAETLTVDCDDLLHRITPRTKAIMPMHYAGIAAEMDTILQIARAHSLVVIEDAAQGVQARYRQKSLGTIGDMGAYSFHDTKNFVSGEGGAFLTNTLEYARRAEIIREKGTNRSNFLRGEVDKYTWVSRGSSYILSDILAAVLKHQLLHAEEILEKRRQIHERYMEGLRDLQNREKLRLPMIPSHCQSNYHIFYILLQDEQERNRVLREMKTGGIGVSFHYIPLHSAPYAREHLATASLHLPVTDAISSRLLRLPIYPSLGDEDVEYVIERLHSALR